MHATGTAQAASGPYDSVLASHQVLNSTGAPVANSRVTVVALPFDMSSWRSDDPYPTVGSGVTDSNGYVQATLDPGLDGVQGNPAFANESDGRVTLAVDYTGASGAIVQAFAVPEDVASYVDPPLARQTVTANGSPAAGVNLIVKAEEQYTSQWPSGTSYPQIGSCQTDGEGHPQCALDLSSVDNNPTFDQRGILTFDVWQQTGSGLQFAFRTEEYVDAAWDPNLLQQQLRDGAGVPLSTAPIEVRAMPADPTSWAGGAYPLLGVGSTDASGYIEAQDDPNAVLNNPAFVRDGSLTVRVDYRDSSGNWQRGSTYTEDLGTRVEPVMNKVTIDDSTGQSIAAGTPLLARLEPVDPVAWSGDFPVVAVGAADSAGHPVLTPALGPYLNNPTWETTNEVMIVDLYRQAADGSWALVQHVPYYFGWSKDPILAQTRILDPSTSDPVANSAVVVRAVPVDPGTWPRGRTFPAVGTGASDATGMIDARLNLSRTIGNPTFEDSSNAIKLQVYYYDSSGALQQGPAVEEHFTSSGDPVVIPPLQNASPAGGGPSSVILMAEPLADGGAVFDPSGQPTLATTQADSSGNVGVSLDLSQVTGNTAFETDSGILGGVGVFTTNGSGQPAYQSTASEYVGPQITQIAAPNIVDVTQKAWGAAEQLGCLASNNYSYADPNYANTSPQTKSTNGTCEVTSTGTPYPDAAATGSNTSAVMINLDWSSLEDTGPSFDTNPIPGTDCFYYDTQGDKTCVSPLQALENEVYAILHAGKSIVLALRFQAEGFTQQNSCSNLSNQYLPSWLITDLGGDTTTGSWSGSPYCDSDFDSSDNVIMDGASGSWLPNYWNGYRVAQDPATCSTHANASDYYWLCFVAQVAAYFSCQPVQNVSETLCDYLNSPPRSLTYNASDVAYVRTGLGLADEG
ncbi:MAG TPA: hypothetical protein VG815_18205, partial [Chloroflexota bacterium]|nr:hypothetical protein [Chloroflexota bacterium]